MGGTHESSRGDGVGDFDWATGADEPVAGTALALKLRRLRNLRTQREVALILGISPALVSTWETSMAIPPNTRLHQYAEAFGEPGDGLLEELLMMRADAVPAPPPREEFSQTTLDVLKDIRWLLVQIRDRLPPRGPP
jgi:transcriptional regulator with XRE-family HTH domain